MADKDLRTDQSAEPGADDTAGPGTGGESGGSAGGSGGTTDGDRLPVDDPGTGAGTDPLGEESPKDGPMIEADADDLEGTQQGTGGGGGGGSFFEDVVDAVENVDDTVEDAIEDPAGVPGDAYDAWKTLDDAPGEAYGDANSWAADRLWGQNSVEDVYDHQERQVADAWDDSGVGGTYDDVEEAVTKGHEDTEDAVADGWTTSGARGVYDDVEESVVKGHDDTAETLDDGYDAWRTLDNAPGEAYSDANSWAADRIWGQNSVEDVYRHHERQVADAYDDAEAVATDPAGAASDALYGTGAGSDTPDAGEPTEEDESGSEDPLDHLDDQNWNRRGRWRTRPARRRLSRPSPSSRRSSTIRARSTSPVRPSPPPRAPSSAEPGKPGAHCRHAARQPDPGERGRPLGRATGPLRGPHSRQVRRPVPPRRAHRGRLRRVDLQRRHHPQRRPQRGRRATQGGVRHRADRLRRDAPRLLRHQRAGQGHERRRRPRVDVLPVVPRILRPPVRRLRGQGPRPRRAPGLQRLARRRVGRLGPRPLHPHGPARHVGPRAGGRRGAAHGGQGLLLGDLHREPGHARLPELPRRPLGPAVDRGVRRGRGALGAPRLVRASWWSPPRTPRWT